MTSEPTSITKSAWYRLIAPNPKPDIWDLCVGNGQHLAWDRCWSYVLSRVLTSNETGIVWAIAYAVKSAVEESAKADIEAAYEEGWNHACADWLRQGREPDYAIGRGKTGPTLTTTDTPA